MDFQRECPASGVGYEVRSLPTTKKKLSIYYLLHTVSKRALKLCFLAPTTVNQGF